MPLPERLAGRLSLPAIAAPMFLVSGPDLVVETCRSGVIGSFPALNQRSSEGYADWLQEIPGRLAAFDGQAGPVAPYAVNLVVHRSNPRLQADLKITVDNRVPLVITSLGANEEVVQAVHGYGGLVFHDVINLRHARKAAEAGVDGIIAVCSGAGGHASTLSAFALVPEIRRIFDGTIILGGAISTGAQIAAAQLLGADMAYIGTRFLATRESLAFDAQKEMVRTATAEDIVYTPAISGVNGNFLAPSLQQAGLDPNALPEKLDFGTTDARAWKDVWAAGQGVGSIDDVPPAAGLVDRLRAEYRAAIDGIR